MKRLFLALAALVGAALLGGRTFAQEPDGTYLFAHRDTCDLFMDVYEAAPGSETTLDGKAKPTLLFVFGGGFIGGARNEPWYFPWFKRMGEAGYRVISIDYRLGLKGVKMDFSPFGRIKTAKNTIKAEYMGVEDLFSAVSYICENAEALGVDPANIVLMGSSAGAIISLAAEQSICNADSWAAALPEGFNFAGVISYAGAIVGEEGVPRYKTPPCPTLFFHGTADDLVQYDKTQVMKLGMWGSNVLADVFRKNGYPHCIYRFRDHAHDIAANFMALWPYQQYFLEQNVIAGKDVCIDALIDDPNVPKWETFTLKTLY